MRLMTLPANVHSEVIPRIQKQSPLVFTLLGAGGGFLVHVWAKGIYAGYKADRSC